MIEYINITNHLGESTKILMENPSTSGFSIRRIDGLTPPKATINLTEIVTLDGGYYNSARVGYRNITLILGLQDGYINNVLKTIEELRLECYRMFSIKKELQLEIKTAARNVFISGYVESCELEIFSRDQIAQVSIICPSAYFFDVVTSFVEFSYVTKLFQFPFSNESTSSKLLNMGTISIMTERNIEYYGDSPVGVFISIYALGAVTDLTIYNASTNETMFINSTKVTSITGSNIKAGDRIYISTVKGNKYIYLIRDGITYNILGALQSTSSWFQLQYGDNLFNYSAVSGTGNMTFSVEHNTIYQGV